MADVARTVEADSEENERGNGGNTGTAWLRLYILWKRMVGKGEKGRLLLVRLIHDPNRVIDYNEHFLCLSLSFLCIIIAYQVSCPSLAFSFLVFLSVSIGNIQHRI